MKTEFCSNDENIILNTKISQLEQKLLISESKLLETQQNILFEKNKVVFKPVSLNLKSL